MPECERTTCSARADHLVEFPTPGRKRRFCSAHLEDLKETYPMDVEEVRRL